MRVGLDAFIGRPGGHTRGKVDDIVEASSDAGPGETEVDAVVEAMRHVARRAVAPSVAPPMAGVVPLLDGESVSRTAACEGAEAPDRLGPLT